MIKSMTGYGRGEAQNSQYKVTIELKSLNQRFLEIMVRLPRQLNPLEDFIKKTLQAEISRGKVDVFISLEEAGSKNTSLKVDNDLALVYYKSLLQLAATCKLKAKIDLQSISMYPGVITAEKEEADAKLLSPVVEEALNLALNSLLEMRSVEGAGLYKDLTAHNENIGSYMSVIAENVPKVAEEYKSKLRLRINELLEDISIDESRFANEVAFFADKSDISEELARMQSHLKQFADALNSTEAIGRKLEFILQEMNREINTIGSKANSLPLGQLVIDVKSELEKMREQAQNVE